MIILVLRIRRFRTAPRPAHARLPDSAGVVAGGPTLRVGGPRCGARRALGRFCKRLAAIPAAHSREWREMKTIKEVGQARRWRHLAHRHGSNLLGGVMVAVMLYALTLAALAS